MRGLCNKCEKRNTCTTLCKQAELYVNQDNVIQKELVPNKPLSDKMNNETCWDSINFGNSRTLKNVIIDLHKSGMPNRQITEECWRIGLTRILKKYRC